MIRSAAVLKRWILPLLCVLWTASCMVGPDYRQPTMEMPDAWHQELTRGLTQGEANLRTWWTTLGDPMLDSLIERAGAANLDVREAVGRVLEARARRGISGSDRYPDVDGTGAVQRSRVSKEVSTGVPPPQSRVDTSYSSGFDSFWELDLWGRVTRSIEASDASLQASIEDYRDVLVVLYADVATTYVDVRTFQERIRYAEQNVETQRGSLKLTIDRRDAGIGSDLDVAQARQNLSSTEAFIPGLRIGLAASIHRLGVLLGQEPTALYAELAPEGEIPVPPTEVVIGVPTELMRQRPDIRSAERQLAAATSEIGIATADLYPAFSLVGSFTFESFASGDWLTSRARAYGFGPSLRWNLFDGGRVRNQIRVEDAQTEQLLASYEETVLFALQEVEDSMVAFVEEQERREALQRSVDASRDAVRLVKILYKTGLTDFQNVLDTERTQFDQEDQLAESEGTVTNDLIRLYKALGGGWSPST